MCEALRELMKDEIEKEKEQGIFENAVLLIRNLMKNTGISAEQAMENLGISVADRSKYIAKL